MADEQIFGGRYQVEAVVGDGGMARVFRAHDTRLGRTVALKVLREQFAVEQQFVERFIQEARMAAGLAHPNIVGVYDVGADHGLQYIVMEYVDGENLRQIIAREAPMALATVIPILRQLAAALDYAHDHGIVHRDIKPENILVTDKGVVKVGDFGIARALASAGLTATGTVLGSVSYFSPEQASGQAATAESDLYSMAIVLYEMLTRQVPFAGPNPVAVALAQVNDPPPSPRALRPDLPPTVEAALLKALAKNPSARYHSGHDLLLALQAPQPQQRLGRRGAATMPAMAPTLPNPSMMAAVPPRPRRQGSGGAIAALLTTAALLVAAVLVGRGLASNDHTAGGTDATATQPAVVAARTTATPAAPTVTPAIPTAQPGSTSVPLVGIATATPHAAPATSTPVPPAATSTPAIPTDTPPIATQTPVVVTATPAVPTDTPVSGSIGDTTLDLVTALGVGKHFAPVGVTSMFPANAKAVYAFATVHHKPKGASIRFVWRYPDGSTFPYDNQFIAPYTDTVAYAELFPRGIGTYSVSASIRGHQLASVTFTVAAGVRADTSAAATAPGQSGGPGQPDTPVPGHGKHGKGNGNGNGNGNNGGD